MLFISFNCFIRFVIGKKTKQKKEMLITIIALILPVILVLWMKKAKKVGVLLPPGPKPLPIIGNLHLLSSPPFKSLRDLSNRYGPIMYLKLGSAAAVVVSSAEVAKQMLREHDPSFANRPQGVAIEILWYNYVDMVFCPYGEYWRQMRKICINHLLSPRMVRTFASIRRDEAARLVDSLRLHSSSDHPVINLTEKMMWFSSFVTCRAAFGKVCSHEENQTVIKMIEEAAKLVSGFEIADLFPSSRIVRALSWTRVRVKMMHRKLDVILDDIINQHATNLAAMDRGDDSGRSGNSEFGSEDLVDVLLRIKEEEQLQFPIDNNNIKAVLFDIFAAGTETSSTTIDWAMTELMRNPQVMAKAQAEVRQVLFKKKGNTSMFEEDEIQKLKYLKLVIKESLRLHPPVPLLLRASREECEINGYTIPTNVKVMVNIWAMQRDPQCWKNPEKFEPERFENEGLDFAGGDFQFLPFGGGRRICPGIAFGLTTVELALAHMLYYFDWKLPEGVKAEDLDMMEISALTASRRDPLFVVATPYHPAV